MSVALPLNLRSGSSSHHKTKDRCIGRGQLNRFSKAPSKRNGQIHVLTNQAVLTEVMNSSWGCCMWKYLSSHKFDESHWIIVLSFIITIIIAVFIEDPCYFIDKIASKH